jgi:fructokinase
MSPSEYPGPACWCGKSSCIERWISGTGFADDHARANPGTPPLAAPEIVALARNGDASARATLDLYIDRLARSLSAIINLIDPDIIVLGGGMSNIAELYERLPPLLPRHVFGGEVTTSIRPSHHGDSSGVRGAARLWPHPVTPFPPLRPRDPARAGE